MDAVFPYLAAFLPPIGLFVLGYFLYRSITGADKQERAAYARAVEEYKHKNALNAEIKSDHEVDSIPHGEQLPRE